MNNLAYLAIQFTTAIALYLVIFRIYLQPWFRAQTFERAILPLLVLHAFRYLGLSLVVNGQVDAAVSRDALAIMAWGDYASGICALIAVIAISLRSRLAVPLVILFSVVGIGDLLTVGPTALNAGVFEADIGAMWFLLVIYAMWFLLVIYAPILLLTHIYIVVRLVAHLSPSTRASTS